MNQNKKAEIFSLSKFCITTKSFQNLFALFIFLFCAGSCIGQISDTPTFCWMALSKEERKPTIIFGTVHHLGPKPILQNKQLMKFVLASKVIVLESDTTELLHTKDTGEDYTSNIPLDELLGFTDYQFVKNEFYSATGKNLDEYKNWMPTIIMTMIDNGKELQEKNVDHTPLMENAFYAVSVVYKIPIVGLETRKQNFELMYKSMPLKAQAELLMYDLRDLKFNNDEVVSQNCFEKNDLQCLCNMDDMNNYTRPGDSTIIITRNLFWINEIKKYVNQGNAFVAVGAAHLCGNFSIIALLKKEGYFVVPILLK